MVLSIGEPIRQTMSSLTRLVSWEQSYQGLYCLLPIQIMELKQY